MAQTQTQTQTRSQALSQCEARLTDLIENCELDEISIADVFADYIAKDSRFFTESESWRRFDGKRWTAEGKQPVHYDAIGITEEIKRLAIKAASSLDEKEAKAVLAAAKKVRSHQKISAFVAIARSMPNLQGSYEQLDLQRRQLNVSNGIVDLETGILHKHDPEQFHSHLIDIDYDPDAKCPTWEKTVGSIFQHDESLIDYVQRSVGYSATGEVSEQVLFFLYGNGANGKSTFTEIIHQCLGSYAQKAPQCLLTKKKNDAPPAEVARLQGARFVAANETEHNTAWAESQLKELTGGDRITARYMRENYFEFAPTHSVWVSGNHKPRVNGNDHGIWRRMRLIPFTHTFTDAEKDLKIMEKLEAEKEGILTWIVKGAMKWCADGLQTPDRVKETTAAYKREEDRVGNFLSDCVVIDDKISAAGSLTATEMYDHYKAHCEDHGLNAFSRPNLQKQLTERGLITKRSNGQRWVGTRSKTEADWEAEERLIEELNPF